MMNQMPGVFGQQMPPGIGGNALQGAQGMPFMQPGMQGEIPDSQSLFQMLFGGGMQNFQESLPFIANQFGSIGQQDPLAQLLGQFGGQNQNNNLSQGIIDIFKNNPNLSLINPKPKQQAGIVGFN